MKVFNFLNHRASDFVPDGQKDTWGNYTNPDTFKLAGITMGSWQSCQWEPHRFGVSPDSKGFCFKHPLLLESIDKGYYYKFWNQWFAIRDLFRKHTQSTSDFLWFTTNDVFNFYFYPDNALLQESLARDKSAHFINCEALRPSHAVFACDVTYADWMIGCISTVGEYGHYYGHKPDTMINLISDESLARDFYPDAMRQYANCCNIGFNPTPGMDMFHVGRSLLQTLDTIFPYTE
jgi:hypothetical protein